MRGAKTKKGQHPTDFIIGLLSVGQAVGAMEAQRTVAATQIQAIERVVDRVDTGGSTRSLPASNATTEHGTLPSPMSSIAHC